ncbi:hypothetical protein YPPY12_0912, partial [Yersinia pestis PY-12]
MDDASRGSKKRQA